MAVSLASLLVQETKAQIYSRGLAVAQALGLTTTSWAPGDPTRSIYHFVSTVLASLETNVAGFVASGFLDYASGDWLTLLAQQFYRVERVGATYATTTVTLSNGGGGYYDIAPGDVTVKASGSGKTFTNTSAGILASGPGTTLALDFVADEAGSASSVVIGDVDTMVTGLLGVTCSNTTAGAAQDEEEDEPLRDRCRAKLGMLSPNGPRDIYDYVVRTPSLSGSDEITRSRTISDSDTGDVTVYVAGTGGAVSGAALTAAETALATYAVPNCTTPHVVNCTLTAIDITYAVWLYASVGEDETAIKAAILAELTAMLNARPIGGDIIAPATTGAVYQSLIASTIRDTYPDHAFRVTVSVPSGDTALAINAIPTIGTVSGTVYLEAAP